MTDRYPLQIGDLVKLPEVSGYWWSGKIGIVDQAGADDVIGVDYRVLFSGMKYVKFGDPEWVEILSKAKNQ
jgi:hypothetical protein